MAIEEIQGQLSALPPEHCQAMLQGLDCFQDAKEPPTKSAKQDDGEQPAAQAKPKAEPTTDTKNTQPPDDKQQPKQAPTDTQWDVQWQQGSKPTPLRESAQLALQHLRREQPGTPSPPQPPNIHVSRQPTSTAEAIRGGGALDGVLQLPTPRQSPQRLAPQQGQHPPRAQAQPARRHSLPVQLGGELVVQLRRPRRTPSLRNKDRPRALLLQIQPGHTNLPY